MSYETKDSGHRDNFETGARRDTQDDKPRYDLIPMVALTREAELFGRGAKKYGERNFQKGMPYMRVFASLLRHAYQWREGDTSEDHLAAVRFNAAALMYYEDQNAKGRLPDSLDDREDDPPDPLELVRNLRSGRLREDHAPERAPLSREGSPASRESVEAALHIIDQQEVS